MGKPLKPVRKRKRGKARIKRKKQALKALMAEKKKA